MTFIGQDIHFDRLGNFNILELNVFVKENNKDISD